MRNHLHHCLKNGVFVEFTVLRISRKISKVTKTVSVPIYCYCRMPDKGKMIRCTMCDEWYHVGLCVVPSKTQLQKNQCHGTVLFNLITIVIVIFTHYNNYYRYNLL